MELLKTFRVMHGADRLKQWPKLSDGERTALHNSIVTAGAGAIQSIMKTLGHADARRPALDILEALLDDASLPEYIEALASPNPTIVSGITQVLMRNSRYDPTRLLPSLADDRISRASLEAVLVEKGAMVRPRSVLELLPNVDKPSRVVLFKLLEKHPDPSLASHLVPMLRDPDWWMRLQVTKVISNLDSDVAVRSLTKLVDDENNHVRHQAVKGLRARQARVAIPELARRLGDADLKVQTAAIDTLIEFGDVAAVPHLLVVLADESEHARRGAVEVLNAVATTEAIQDLIGALRDHDWWVRVRAADALGALGGERVVEAVVALLAVGDDFQRRYVVEILNAVPHEKAVEPLIRALQDQDWWVRERSIDALGGIGDRRAVEPLIEIMRQDARARALCARALGRIGDSRAFEALSALVASDQEDVQQAATEALAMLRTGVTPAAAVPGLPAGILEPPRGHTRVLSPGRERPEMPPAPPAAAAPARVPSAAPAGEPKERRAEPAMRQLGFNHAKIPPGTVFLDRYRVVRRIGSGGFGVVYLVEDAAIQEQVILKVLNPQLSVDEKELRRFIQELKLTRRVSARNVIRIFDLLDLGGVHAVSMEYFEGQDLGQLLAESGRMSVIPALEIALQVCQGLDAAHNEGVVHRDIKPANILVGPGGAVKIVDFGLAWAQQVAGSRLTKTGLLVGTPEYMAPELINGEVVDHLADIYSVGIVLYEMLSGRKPYEAATVLKVLFQHLEGQAAPLDSLVANLPPGVVLLVQAAMQRDPDQRPQSARDLGAMLEMELSELKRLEGQARG